MATQVLEQLARAFLTRERDRLGITERERAAGEATDVSQLRQAQARRIAQGLELAPAAQESQIELQGAQADAARALAGQREVPKPGTPHYVTDARGNVRAITPAGGNFGIAELGPIGTPQRAPQDRVGKFAFNTSTRRPEYVTDEQLKAAPPGLFVDITTGRKGSETAEVKQNVDILIGNAEERLNRYTSLLTGIRRFTPAQVDPEKFVAFDSYRNALQSLGQLFGRSVLKDQRVSDQDRAVYAEAIGSTSQIVNVIDPEEAKRRLDLLKQLVDYHETKYGFLSEGGLGNQQSGGAGAPAAPGTGGSGSFRVIGVRQ